MSPYASPGVEEFKVELESGEEWHSDAYELRDGDTITLSCKGDGNFYAGIFAREEYYDLRGSEGGAFGFEFGTDKQGYTERVHVPDDEEYYVVLRVGVFTSGPVSIQVRLKVDRPRRGLHDGY